jgi:phosphate transport system substrate-binding protein
LNLITSMRRIAAASALLAAASFPVHALTASVDPDLPEYTAVEGVSGSIKSVGSDTMNNMIALWGEGFRKFYPNVQIEIEGKGSSTAPAALIAGAASFGPMSRPMKGSELDEFEKQFGYKPTGLPVSLDVLAVYVNKDNPIEGLTMQQVDAIFSSTRRGGFPSDIRTWGDLGMTGAWAAQPISLYGRNAASGTYGYFKENALFNGDYKDSVKEQPGSSSVVQAIAGDRYAIGYSGIGYITEDVRAVPLASAEGEEYFEANVENAYSGNFPLARYLLIYINAKPGDELDPLRREFVRYMFSRQGQEDVVRDGYIPVGAAIARETLEAVGITPGF